MQSKSDAQLLREYAESGLESAFAEIVDRHTDLVYSAALRQVDSADLAGDVAQNVFTDLARKAAALSKSLPEEASLVGWLYRGTRFEAGHVRRSEYRRQTRERHAMQETLSNPEPAVDWESIGPVLDEAMEELSDADRDALLLRFFKSQDFRAVGLALGVSDDTAQKRVSRAIEKLREAVAKRGVVAGVGALGLVIAANAVQAAPVGLALTITTTALVSGTAVPGSAGAIATKAIVMTTLQKSLVAAVLTALVGAGVYQTTRVSQLQRENRALERQRAPLLAQVQGLQRERDDASNRLASLSEENASLKRKQEVLKLRGEVGRLRQENTAISSSSPVNKLTSDPQTKSLLRNQQKTALAAIYKEFGKRLNLPPDQVDKLNDLLADHVMDNVDRIISVLHDGKNPDEMRAVFASSEASFDQQVQSLLGADGAAQFEDYTHNLGSYLTSEQFKSMLEGDEAAKDAKAKQVYEVMQEEVRKALASAGLPADYQVVPSMNFLNIASADEGERSLKLLDDIYSAVATQLGSFLSAAELAKFQDFRKAAINNSRLALDVNRKLMAPIGQ